jgi:hypothetical protein
MTMAQAMKCPFHDEYECGDAIVAIPRMLFRHSWHECRSCHGRQHRQVHNAHAAAEIAAVDRDTSSKKTPHDRGGSGIMSDARNAAARQRK